MTVTRIFEDIHACSQLTAGVSISRRLFTNSLLRGAQYFRRRGHAHAPQSHTSYKSLKGHRSERAVDAEGGGEAVPERFGKQQGGQK